jgi:hypothetical protein
MEVLGLSLGRTGSACQCFIPFSISVFLVSIFAHPVIALYTALKILGYPTCHGGFAMFTDSLGTKMWIEGLRAKFFPEQDNIPGISAKMLSKYEAIEPFGREEFDHLLGQYSAVLDAPSNVFAPELVAAYPSAKAIIVERDIESWYSSWEKAVIANHFNEAAHKAVERDEEVMMPVITMTGLWVRGYFGAYSKEELEKRSREVLGRIIRALGRLWRRRGCWILILGMDGSHFVIS